MTPPSVAIRKALKEYSELLKKKEELERRLREIDEELRSLFPTIEFLDDIRVAHYQGKAEQLDQKIAFLIKEREKLRRKLEEISQKISFSESEAKEWKRIYSSFRTPIKWGKILIGIFSVLIAARIFSTSDLLNQSFGIIPGILGLFDIKANEGLAQRIVCLLDFIIIESLLTAFFYSIARALFTIFDVIFKAINKPKLQIIFYSFISLTSFAVVTLTFFTLSLKF